MSDDKKPVSLIGTIQIPIKIQGEEKEFMCQISPPGPMAPVEDLENALKRNRELLDECQQEMAENMRKDYFEREPPWLLNYEGPVQNALMARFNINVLIPLINMKGGKAKFTKIESMPVKFHVEKLMAKAEKALLMEEVEKGKPFGYAFAISMIVAAFVVLLVSIL